MNIKLGEKEKDNKNDYESILIPSTETLAITSICLIMLLMRYAEEFSGIIPAILAVEAWNFMAFPIFFFIEKVMLNAIEHGKKVRGVGKEKGDAIVSTIFTMVAFILVFMLNEGVMKRRVLLTPAGDISHDSSTFLEMAVSSLMYSNFFLIAFRRYPKIGIVACTFMVLLTGFFSSVFLGVKNLRLCDNMGKNAIGSVTWDGKAWIPFVANEDYSSFINELATHFIPQIFTVLGNDKPYCRTIVFADAPHQQKYLDEGQGGKIIVPVKAILDKLSTDDSIDLTEALFVVFHNILDKTLLLHSRYLSDSLILRSFLLSAVGLVLVVSAKFLNKFILSLLGISDSEKNLKTRTFTFVRYLIIYLAGVFLLALISMNILHSLGRSYSDNVISLKEIKMKEISGMKLKEDDCPDILEFITSAAKEMVKSKIQHERKS